MRQAYLPAGYNEQSWLRGCVKEVDRELFFEKIGTFLASERMNTLMEYITTTFFVITMFFGAYVALWVLAE